VGLWNEDGGTSSEWSYKNVLFYGGRWLREQHGTLSLPLMVRPNTVLPVGANEGRPDYDYADGVTYHVFALDAGAVATAQVPALDGSITTTVEVRREGDRIEVQVQGVPKPWSVLLRGVSDGTSAGVASVAGGTAKVDELGVRVVPDAGTRSVVVRLAESI
jgi:alpha-D-xyloside xylohydrolase